MTPAQRVVWTGPGQVSLESFDLRDPGRDEVLLRAHCSLISPGTERAFLLGLENAQGNFPSYPGYNFVGSVAAFGSDSPPEGWRPGQRVACAAGHASHAVISLERCVTIPDGVEYEDAAFFNMCGIALQGVRKGRIELGDSVAVLGLGLVGQLTCRLAKLSGGLPVIGLDPVASRRARMLQGGGDAALDPSDPEGCAEALSRLCPKGQPAVVIDATGHPEAIPSAFQLCAPFGRVVLLGSTRGETQRVNFYRDVHKKGLTVIGAHNSARPSSQSSRDFWTWRDDCELVLRMMGQARLDLSPLVSHRYPARDAEKAYERLMAWDEEFMGVILTWS